MKVIKYDIGSLVWIREEDAYAYVVDVSTNGAERHYSLKQSEAQKDRQYLNKQAWYYADELR
jgi:hypothetical protein